MYVMQGLNMTRDLFRSFIPTLLLFSRLWQMFSVSICRPISKVLRSYHFVTVYITVK
jgi:hypothetical protein